MPAPGTVSHITYPEETSFRPDFRFGQLRRARIRGLHITEAEEKKEKEKKERKKKDITSVTAGWLALVELCQHGEWNVV